MSPFSKEHEYPEDPYKMFVDMMQYDSYTYPNDAIDHS